MRVQNRSNHSERPDGDFVLYWMTAARRPHDNFALDRAIEWARKLERPLVVFEALRAGYRWASDRIHTFVIEGMKENEKYFARTNAEYFSYVEPEHGAGSGLLEALAKRACVVVTDEFPCFFLPRMLEAVAPRMRVLLETVDGNGILPMRAAGRAFTTAHSFRRFLQKTLPDHLETAPDRKPSYRGVPPADDGLVKKERKRWPSAGENLAALPIDHDVGPAPLAGGFAAAEQRWDAFDLERYADDRNIPDKDGPSGLSPYLHFGHISPHRVLCDVFAREKWNPGHLGPKTDGSRKGWWGLAESTEAFLDQLVTWRELGYNMCHLRDDFDQYESLPDFALETLADHADDERPHVYSLEEFERAATHDELWNAAQRQLTRDGTIHNYLRMLWGKKILEWTPSPRDALEIMIELNNKYALDGRNPNSYSGIFWVLGRYDRAWGPERPIFGKVRYMTSKNTARKVSVKAYLDKYGEPEDPQGRE